MEARGRSRKSMRRINARHQIRAWMSMVLTAVMIIGNMATSVNTVLAATPAPREEFQIRAKDIQKAAEKALDKGEAVSKDILISGKDENVVKEYEKLFAADGKLYELNLTKETGTVKGVDGVNLRVFMRLPEDADPKTHVLNGEEELYFVYINDGEESVSVRLNIDGLISGFSTVRAYEAVFGDEEEKDGESASGGSALGNGSGAGDVSGSEDISDAENTGNGTSDESGKPGNEEAKQDSEAADENVNPGEESKEAGREEEGEAVSQDGESIEAVQNHESRAEETAAEESREEIATEASDKYHPTESEAASEEGKADAEDNEGSSKEENSKEDNQEVNGKEENNSAEADRKEDNGEATGNQENDSKVDGSKENDSKENNNKENGSKENDNKGNSSEVSSEKESSQKDENHGQESEKAASENKDGEKSADKAEAGNKSGSEQSGADKDKSSGSEQKTEKDSSKEEKSGAKDDKASSGNDHKEDSKSGDSKSSDSKSENSSAKEVSINSLQISLHQILRVAEPEDISAEEIETSEISETEEETETEDEAEQESEEELETEEESEIETEPEIEEESEPEKETEVLTETEAEIEVVTGENAETESKAEAMTEETAEMKTGAEAAIEETAEVEAGAEATTGETTETETVFDDEEEIWEEDELAEIEGNQTPVEETDPFKKRGVLEGKVLNLVAFEDGLTARAFVTTLEKLGMNKEDLIEGGHILTYTISPAGSAVVVNAPELVRDESEVIFGVTPQVGYRVFEVTANGEMLEKVNPENLASTSNAEKVNEDYVKEDTEYFRISSVLESQDIEITLKEITEGTHPAFRESKTINGVTITVSAGENILPEGTYLTVEEVTEKVEEAVKENVKAEKGTEVQTVIAYDINLMLDGKKLSNASWSGNYVNVEFSGERIEELKRNGESIEVAPLETPTQVVEAADGEVETLPLLENVTAEDIRVNEDEITRIQEDEGDSIDSIQVRAEHFTVYVIVSSEQKIVNTKTVAKMYCQSNDEQGVQIGDNYYLQYGESDVNFGNETDEILPSNIQLSYNGTSVTVNNVYYMNNNTLQEVSYFKRINSTSGRTTTYTIRAYSADNKQVAVFASGTGSSSGTDNSNNFYWITNEPGHRVEWYINGELNKVTFVADNQSPTPPYTDGEPEEIRGKLKSHSTTNGQYKFINSVNFGGWSTQPNDNKKQNWRTVGTFSPINSEGDEPVRYYAIFTYDTLFYVLLPGKVMTDTGAESYMYVGPDEMKDSSPTKLNQKAELFGKVIVPDGFGSDGNGRWYDGTTQLNNINSLFVENTPGDNAVRKGIELAYPEYKNSNYQYDIRWTTLTISLNSPGYYNKYNGSTKQDTIDSRTILHVDGAISISTVQQVTISYEVRMPDGSLKNAAEQHEIGKEFPLNSTVEQTGKFTTDKHEYDAVIVRNGISYYFDGWYTAEDYKVKAGDSHIPTEAVTFYARYVADDELKYNANASDATGTMNPTQGKISEKVIIADNAFARPGYKFIGWNTQADGKGISYVSGGEYQLTEAEDILYAQWQQLKGSFAVKKILKDGTHFNSAKVEDVTFQLYVTDEKWSNSTIKFGESVSMSGQEQTDTDKKLKYGVFNFSDLPVGYYYLREETTTAGYKILTQDIKIEIRQVGDTVQCICHDYNAQGEQEAEAEWQVTNGSEIPVTNEPAYTAVLPDTGGSGLGLIKEFGWVLLLIALMMAGMEVQYYGERRRKVRIDELSHEAQRFDEF